MVIRLSILLTHDKHHTTVHVPAVQLLFNTFNFLIMQCMFILARLTGVSLVTYHEVNYQTSYVHTSI